MKYCLMISATHRAEKFYELLRKDFFKRLIINDGEGVLKINEYLLMAIVTENGSFEFLA